MEPVLYPSTFPPTLNEGANATQQLPKLTGRSRTAFGKVVATDTASMRGTEMLTLVRAALDQDNSLALLFLAILIVAYWRLMMVLVLVLFVWAVLYGLTGLTQLTSDVTEIGAGR